MYHFYKYREINKYTYSLLINQEMHFSFADEYNDPFDCKVVYDCECTVDDIIKCMDEEYIPNSVKIKIIEKLNTNGVSKKELLQVAVSAGNKNIMSSCFSTDQRNILMWSHYADSHKGICVGFRNISSTEIPGIQFNYEDHSQNQAFKDGVFIFSKVNYDDDSLVKFNPILSDIKPFITAHTNKAKDWSYENEYRIILPYKEFQTQNLVFNKSMLDEIYFGLRIEPNIKEKIVEIVKREYIDYGYQIKLFDMIQSNEKYEIFPKEMLI